MRPVPPELLTGPFSRARALELGLTEKMLRGSRFVRVHPRVWRHRDHVMTADDEVLAAALALPPDAQLTGISRLQLLGLDFGPRTPVRFVVARDLHIDLEGVFLHRTVAMPPLDEIGVTVVAAFVAYCARARVIDAIKVGDWLIANQHLAPADLERFALREIWRAGAVEALWVLPHLHGASRSLPESEVRALLSFAGLPVPEVNSGAAHPGDARRIGDLVFRPWGLVVEYEGDQHQLDRGQYVRDIARYASLRRDAVPYVQVTKEKLARPRRMVAEVHAALVGLGYAGPAPDFGERWRWLFSRISDVVAADRRWAGVRSKRRKGP